MKTIDKKQAALKMYVLLAWLEKHPNSYKDSYPLYNELNYNKNLFMSPWCSIYRKPILVFDYQLKNKFDCTECPIHKKGDECFTKHPSFFVWKLFNNSASEKRKKEESIVIGDNARVAWEEYKKLGG